MARIFRAQYKVRESYTQRNIQTTAEIALKFQLSTDHSTREEMA